MISALSAYKAMIEASAGRNSGEELQNSGDIGSSLDSALSASKSTGNAAADAVSVDISTSANVFTAVDNFFNLGGSDRFGDFHKLSDDDKEQFVKIVAALAKTGYAGYEDLVVNNKVERHDILNEMGDPRLRHAKVYKK